MEKAISGPPLFNEFDEKTKWCWNTKFDPGAPDHNPSVLSTEPAVDPTIFSDNFTVMVKLLG